MPKGRRISQYLEKEVLRYADELNALPRRCLGYQTPEELFENKLDEIYAA